MEGEATDPGTENIYGLRAREFDLPLSEQARLARIAVPGLYSPRLSIGLGAANIVMGVVWLVNRYAAHHPLWDSGLGVFYCAIGATWVFQGFRSLNGRGVPARASLEFTDAGLSGTVDGVPATIRWQDISGVRDCAGAYAVDLRKAGSRSIAIPKAALGDPAAFWALCEDHLIAKRGLVRSPYPRTRIINTAC